MSTQRQDCNKPSKNRRLTNHMEISVDLTEINAAWIKFREHIVVQPYSWFDFYLPLAFFKDVEIWWKLDVSFYTSFKISEEPFEAKRAYDLRYIRGGSREEKGSPLPFTEFLVRLTCSVVLSARLLLWSGRPLTESWQHKMPKQCKTHCE